MNQQFNVNPELTKIAIGGASLLPKVYRVEYWENGWRLYCLCFNDSYKGYMKVAETKSPINLARKTLLEVRS